MSRLPSSQAEAALERLADQFTHWRQSRATAHERIPNPMWAVENDSCKILPDSRKGLIYLGVIEQG